MVNLRHPDTIFYDREGDLFVITTDLDGRQEGFVRPILNV